MEATPTPSCNRYKNDGLKIADIVCKIISLQWFWIKQLYDNSSHPWKIITSNSINTYLEKKYKFDSNVGIAANKLKCFIILYKVIF